MEQFRRTIQEKPGEFLELIRKTQEETGIPVTAQLYKRPRPTDNPALQEFFRWKNGIQCVCREPVGPEMFGPELEGRVARQFEQVMPLYDFFNRILAQER